MKNQAQNFKIQLNGVNNNKYFLLFRNGKLKYMTTANGVPMVLSTITSYVPIDATREQFGSVRGNQLKMLNLKISELMKSCKTLNQFSISLGWFLLNHTCTVVK